MHMLMLISGPLLTSFVTRTFKARRQALGMRQSDLAARCSVAEATIVRFERTGKVSLAVFAQIAVGLDLARPLAEAIQNAMPPEPPARTAEEFLLGPRKRQRVRLPKATD